VKMTYPAIKIFFSPILSPSLPKRSSVVVMMSRYDEMI